MSALSGCGLPRRRSDLPLLFANEAIPGEKNSLTNMKSILTLALVLGTISVMRVPATADLVGCWNFDEGSGTEIVDSSGVGNNGTLVNPKPGTWATGRSGGGLYLDGTTGTTATRVVILDHPSLHATNAVSFAAWVRCDDVNRDAPILAKEGDGNLSYWFGTFGPAHFGVLLDLDGNQPWTIYDRDQGRVPQGIWVHLASTWDGVTIRHYLNGGLLQETAAFAGPIHVSGAGLSLGANFPYNTTAFKGSLDEVRLYNHALSADEIRVLADGSRRMVGYWPLDEGAGTNIADLSGNANSGLLVNAREQTWTTGISGAALYFEGITNAASTYVAIPDAESLRITAEISFAAWVRCDDVARDAPILAKEGDGHLCYWFGAFGLTSEGAAPGNFGVLLDGDGNQPWTALDRNQGSIPQAQWVHLASTWDGSVIRHYLNGEQLPQTGSFAGPIFVSDAFLAIGVNSLYNYTAFEGVIDEVRLYNYALSPEEVRRVYLGSLFSITSVNTLGDAVRLEWECIPGRQYIVQTNTPPQSAGFVTSFGDLSQPIVVPADYGTHTTNYVHAGALTNTSSLFYRVKMLP